MSFELELGKAGHIVAFEMCRVRKGESVIITVDSVMDMGPPMEVAKACEAAGGKVLLAWHTTPRGYGKVADPQLPESLKAAIPAADVWVEFNNQWLLYSSAWLHLLTSSKIAAERPLTSARGLTSMSSAEKTLRYFCEA